jgi:hypothetical protein
MIGAACGLVFGAIAAREPRAGVLQITVTEGPVSYLILDDCPLDTLLSPPPENINRIQPLAAALVFADYKLVGLNASTNNPGDSSGAILTVGGEIQRITSGAAPSLIIQMTDTDYMLPFAGRALHSTMSTTFSNALSSSTRTFTGFYNPSNAPDAKDIAQGAPAPLSAGLFLNSHGDTAAAVVVPDAPLFGLTSSTEFSNLTAGADVVFDGSVQVASAPEPASMVLLVSALPFLAWAVRRKRRG